jgi:accessory gene regulator protein AgrB
MRSGVPASPFKAPTADLPVTPQYLAPKGESKSKNKSKNKNKSKSKDLILLEVNQSLQCMIKATLIEAILPPILVEGLTIVPLSYEQKAVGLR